MCCVQAGIAVQLCCWMHGLSLEMGHSEGDRQIEDTQILLQQKQLAAGDPTSDRPLLRIFDKGYRQRIGSHKHGQMCCRPDLADCLCGIDKALRTKCVAVVGSGNERADNGSKISWFVKRSSFEVTIRFGNLICFRTNFMFKDSW